MARRRVESKPEWAPIKMIEVRPGVWQAEHAPFAHPSTMPRPMSPEDEALADEIAEAMDRLEDY